MTMKILVYHCLIPQHCWSNCEDLDGSIHLKWRSVVTDASSEEIVGAKFQGTRRSTWWSYYGWQWGSAAAPRTAQQGTNEKTPSCVKRRTNQKEKRRLFSCCGVNCKKNHQDQTSNGNAPSLLRLVQIRIKVYEPETQGVLTQVQKPCGRQFVHVTVCVANQLAFLKWVRVWSKAMDLRDKSFHTD